MFKLITATREYAFSELEAAGISYIPCGVIQGNEQPLFKFKHLWGEPIQISLRDFDTLSDPTLSQMTGVQVFTGPPTHKVIDKHSYFLIDIDIERHFVDRYPDALSVIGGLYRDHITEGNACITRTKSGGWRLSSYVNYGGNKVIWRDREDNKVLLEVFGKHGMSRYDKRYEIKEGCLLEAPMLDIEVFKKIATTIEAVGRRDTVRARRYFIEKSVIGNMDVQWAQKTLPDGTQVYESQRFTTEHCPITKHDSNREEIRFTKYANGSIDGKCFNCGETWWETPPLTPETRKAVNRSIHRSINRRIQ